MQESQVKNSMINKEILLLKKKNYYLSCAEPGGILIKKPPGMPEVFKIVCR